MYNGVVRTLTNITYVSNLKKNLVSLGILDSQVNKYFIESGVLRVSEGAHVVVNKNFRNGFYFL